jgi:ribosomal protein S18 acetylase RimI-like enzyme
MFDVHSRKTSRIGGGCLDSPWDLTKMKIHIIEKTDINKICQIAGLHATAYSSAHFTAGFSTAKLAEYNSRLVEASDITIVAMDDDKMLGFIISGFSVSVGVRKFTADNRLWLAVQLFKRPRILFNKMVGFVQSRLNTSYPSSAKFRLLSIATMPGFQSKGVGAGMIKFLEQELLSRGVDLYGLSVKDSNIAATRFYERHGFIREKSYLGSSYYIKRILEK